MVNVSVGSVLRQIHDHLQRKEALWKGLVMREGLCKGYCEGKGVLL